MSKRPETLFIADRVSIFLDHLGKVVVRTTSEQEPARYFILDPDDIETIENWFKKVRSFLSQDLAVETVIEKEWIAPSAAWAEGWAAVFRGHDCPCPYREGTDRWHEWKLGHGYGIDERDRLRDRYVEVKT